MTSVQPPEPFFSVQMPVHDGQAYVVRALESVIGQTDPDWEFVIVDDCSRDKTPAILDAYAAKDRRIRVLRNETQKNIAPSLNRGIREARGRWIVRLDADDFYSPTYLSVLRSYASKIPGLDCFISSWVTVVDESGAKILDLKLPDADTVRRMMPLENFLYHPATSFPRHLWEKVNGYPEERTMAEDTALWLRFFEAEAKLIMIPQPLINYRIHYSNITSINDARLTGKMGEKEWKTLRQNKEWRASLFLKQAMLRPARMEIVTLGRMQKHFSVKNMQYFILTFLPHSFVSFFMWELRPRLRALFKNLRGKRVRV